MVKDINRREILASMGVGAVAAPALSQRVLASKSVSVTAEVVGQTTLRPGDTFQVEITGTNNTGQTVAYELNYHYIGPCCYYLGICLIDWEPIPIEQQYIVDHSDDGGEYKSGTWNWKSVSSGTSVNPTITFEIPEDKPPGEYELAFGGGAWGLCHDDVDYTVIDSDSVTITVEDKPDDSTFDLSAQCNPDTAAPGSQTTIDLAVTNTGSITDDVTVLFYPASSQYATADYYGSEFNVASHSDAGGDWLYEGWEWTDVSPGETLNPSVTLDMASTLSTGKYTFALHTENNSRATASLSVEQAFDPDIHGFGFQNWAGEEPENGSFDPPHDHEGLDATWRDQAIDQWLPKINEMAPVPIPKEAVNQYVDSVMAGFTDGAFTTGHCYGMTFAAEQYFESGLPQGVPAQSASEIHQPTGEYSAIGDDIDRIQNQQALDWDIYAQGKALSPPDLPFVSTPEIDTKAEYERIRNEIDDTGVAPVGLGQSPDNGGVGGGALHQVLAYDYKQTSYGRELYVYDPNIPGGQTPSSYNPPGLQSITLDGSSGNLTMETYWTGNTPYDRFGLIGAARADAAGMLVGGLNALGSIVVHLISSAADGLVSVVAHSPVEITVTGPDGNQLPHPSEPILGTPPEEICYQTNASAGEYEITVKGTDNGEYGIEVMGAVPEAGWIQDSISGQISNGETKTHTATVPSDEGTGGGIGGGGGDGAWYAEYVNENGVVDSEGLNAAVRDYLTDNLSASRLNTAIRSYLTGSPIET
jgi:hypothetical protein